MFTSKERARLRAIASTEDTIMQIGKNGVTDALIKALSDALDKRELIKVSVLDNASGSPAEFGNALATALSAEFVCAIGKKVVLYRYSKRDGVRHIEYK